MNAPAIGFIGFGEAAFWIARSLNERGITRTVAYDLHTSTPGRGELIRQRAEEAQVLLVATLAEVPARSDIVWCAVTASAARSVAEAVAPHLRTHQLYIDINSVSPAVKREVGSAVGVAGASYVEAAVMSTVPPLGHRVPMLLCGPGARSFAEQMSPLGMQLEVLDAALGSAAAIKMCRSILVKGLEALMLECVLGAEPYGAADKVFASVAASMPGIDWQRLAHYMIGRTALHAERRVHEMEEVAKTLASAGVDPIMATATARRIQTCADLDLKTRFQGREPADYRDVVQAFRERGEA